MQPNIAPISISSSKTSVSIMVVTILFAALIFMIPAMLNGFPFLFQDSADYLIFTPRLYRSPFYGLFLSFFHLNRFIGGPILAQALITSHLIYILVKVPAPSRTNVGFIVLTLFLAAFSSLPFFVGLIMPDIFTPLMFISLYLIGFYFFTFSLTLRVYILALTCIAISSHLSNIVMALSIVWLFVPLLRWCGRSWRSIRIQFAFLLAPIILTVFAYLLFNSIIFGNFALAPAGQSFFLANMIQYGPARTYLKEACPEAGYKICPYVDRLPKNADDFLWKEGIFDKLGGFAGMASESNTIVLETIKQHPAEVLQMAANNFVTALDTHKPAAELGPFFPTWTSIFDLLAQKFGQDARISFLGSSQMRNAVPHKLIEAIDNVVYPVAFILLIVAGLIAARKGRRDSAALAVFTICAFLGDALLCATVSGVHDRYQARVTWLLPMVVFIVISSLKTQGKIRLWQRFSD